MLRLGVSIPAQWHEHVDAGPPSWHDTGFFNLAKLVSHLYPGRQRERHQGARPGGQGTPFAQALRGL